MGKNRTDTEESSSANSEPINLNREHQTHEVDERNRKFIRWGDLSYTSRLTLAFAMVAIMTVMVAIGVLSFVWEQHFST